MPVKPKAPTSDEPSAALGGALPDGAPRKVAQRGRYISDSILERRRRMLEAAKQMIAEGGAEDFTIREMAQRAKVSVTTIYATYGDKLGLIAAAIEDYYENLPLSRAPQSTSLSALLASKDRVREAILADRPYARHYAELYFSRSVDPRIYNVIRDVSTASGGHTPWLQRVVRDGDLLPGLTLDYVTTLFANHRLLVLHDWAQGRVSDDELGTALKISFLILARAITRGPSLAQVEAELKKLLRRQAIAR